MGKSNTFSNQFLSLIFNGSTIPGLAQNLVSGALTQLWIALHTANPGPAGTQATSEAAYTGYARVALTRNAGGWTISGQQATPNSNIVFPAATGGSETETYFSVGTQASGAGEILYSGPISPPISVISGVTPELLTGTNISEA